MSTQLWKQYFKANAELGKYVAFRGDDELASRLLLLTMQLFSPSFKHGGDLVIEGFVKGTSVQSDGTPWLLAVNGGGLTHNDIYGHSNWMVEPIKRFQLLTLLYVVVTETPYTFNVWSRMRDEEREATWSFTLNSGDWIVFPSRCQHNIVSQSKRKIISIQFLK